MNWEKLRLFQLVQYSKIIIFNFFVNWENLESTALRLTLKILNFEFTQPAITCSKLTIETLEQGVKYAQS